MDEDILEVQSFVVSSIVEIKSVISTIDINKTNQTLIHIESFVENTQLVQELKKELLQIFPNSKIIFFKHQDEVKTFITLFELNKDVTMQNLSNEVLHAFYLENNNAQEHIQEYRKKLFNRYFIDHLTNLPNMYKLRKDIQENEDFGLVLIKINNFQEINNFYGFVVGDFIIEKLGLHLKGILPSDSVYRLTGAEFALVLDKSMGFYDLKEYLSQLYDMVNNLMIQYQDIKIYLDITLASSANKDSHQVFSKVSMALKYAKETCTPFWIYEDRMKFEDEYERNLKLSVIVRDAVDNSRIVPYYQAIIDNKTSKVTKYECLARLIDSNEKVLSPLLFIPVSKKIKVYSSVTKMMINKAFEEFENNDLFFNINLSIDDIMSSEMYRFIMDKLKNSPASSRVTFELLESEAVQDFKKVERFISEVKRYEAKIAIDDFGSGYSNFSYLTKMHADYIKIDGTLIKDIDVDKTAYIVVETIVDFAKKLGIKTIAEYVHSSVVMDKVKELGIDYSQGFYIDEPSIKIGALS